MAIFTLSNVNNLRIKTSPHSTLVLPKISHRHELSSSPILLTKQLIVKAGMQPKIQPSASFLPRERQPKRLPCRRASPIGIHAEERSISCPECLGTGTAARGWGHHPGLCQDCGMWQWEMRADDINVMLGVVIRTEGAQLTSSWPAWPSPA